MKPTQKSWAAPPNRSMAERYGQLMLSSGIAAIPQALYYQQADLNLTAQEVWFISAILAHKWTSELPHPDLESMSHESGITSRQLRRYRVSLESKDYLRTGERYAEEGRQLPNSYDFSGLFARIETLIADGPIPSNEIVADDTYLIADNPREYSFIARYGRTIAAAGVAAIPQALFTYQKALQLSAAQVWFCCYILSHRWSTDLPYPSLRKMAERTGYTPKHLHDLKSSLVEQGYLRVIGRIGADGGQDSNAYDFNGLFEALTAKLQLDIGPIEIELRDLASGEAIDLRSGDAIPGPLGNRGRRTSAIQTTQTPGTHDTRTSGIQGRRTSSTQGRRTASIQTARTPATQATRTASSVGTRTASSHEEEPNHEEPDQEENDSNQRDTQKKMERDQTATPYSPWIAAVIVDYSRELGDIANVQSNTTHAMRLCQNSGLPEEQFVDLLHQARTLTREYQGKQGFGTINNRMAYFFRVLTDIIEKRSGDL